MGRRVLFADAYGRADGALGANYAAITGTLAIVSNRVRQSTVTGALAGMVFASALPSADQFSQVAVPTYANTSQSVFLFGRFNSATDNGYGVELNGGFAQSAKYVSGTATTLGSGASVTVTPGDTFLYTVFGSTLTLYQNGTSVLTDTDSTYASGGSAGYGVKSVTAVANVEIGSFVAGINGAAFRALLGVGA